MAGEGAKKLETLQRRLNYRFKDPSLLARALTHDSLDSDPTVSNERFEFLGDRVLGLAVSGQLLEAFPDANEGELAARFNRLVRGDTCASVAEDLKLGDAIRMADAEAQSGGRKRRTLLADACEALIAAIYLDGGLAAAQTFVERHWRKRMLDGSGLVRDAKTTLQEWTQSRNLGLPSYTVADRSGPDHDPRFVVDVVVSSLEQCSGTGKSKREAEQDAASKMLIREGLWEAAANG